MIGSMLKAIFHSVESRCQGDKEWRRVKRKHTHMNRNTHHKWMAKPNSRDVSDARSIYIANFPSSI